jgi:phosphatidylglycerol---prolipoprotein diacylglyceryl transferase
MSLDSPNLDRVEGGRLVSVVAALAWPILERIHVLGDFAISPHGISVALGFLLGAQLMQRRAQQRGVARRPVEEIPEIIQSLATLAALGAIIGARFFYVATRPELYPDPLDWFKIWEGGLSLFGGFTGGVLASIPYVLRRKLSIRLLLDSLAPGLALGIFIGRIGDLIIGEHLGGRTTFFLGWRCTGAYGDPAAPYPWPGPRVQGCYDAVVHQTALYDFLAAGAVLVILLLLERRPRFDGLFAAVFVLLYGGGRFVSDFARAADLRLLGPFTGSQLTVLTAIGAVGLWILLYKPHRHRPYAWSPPDFSRSSSSAQGPESEPLPTPICTPEDAHD